MIANAARVVLVLISLFNFVVCLVGVFTLDGIITTAIAGGAGCGWLFMAKNWADDIG